jgi:spore maturation protein SpmA
MLNALWLGLVVLAVCLGGITGQLPAVTKAAFEACTKAVVDLALPLAGIMALWLGIMRLAEKSGAVHAIAAALRPLLIRLFPDVPANHPAMGSMVMNMAANMLGLANAATPLGLRAMQDLESLNPRPGTATNAMCTFLAINTSSIQLIPATAVALLAAKGSTQPTAIIGTAFVATLCSTAVAIVTVKLLERLPMFALPPVPPNSTPIAREQEPEKALEPLTQTGRAALAVVFALFALAFVGMAFFPEGSAAFAESVRSQLGVGAPPPAAEAKGLVGRAVDSLSILAIPFFLVLFPVYAAGRRVPVYEEFVEGAKEGFQVAVRIIPYLVAILFAIGMFRAAGGIDLLAKALSPLLQPLGFPTELLPLAFLRPLSGSGSFAVFAELVQTHGADSLIARMGGTIMGSTETTFYVLAVYFGSVAVRRTRHAVPAGLLADVAGIIASVAVCSIAFR